MHANGLILAMQDLRDDLCGSPGDIAEHSGTPPIESHQCVAAVGGGLNHCMTTLETAEGVFKCLCGRDVAVSADNQNVCAVIAFKDFLLSMTAEEADGKIGIGW